MPKFNRNAAQGANAKQDIQPAPSLCTACNKREAKIHFLGVYKISNNQKCKGSPSEFLIQRNGLLTLELKPEYKFGKWITRCNECREQEQNNATS